MQRKSHEGCSRSDAFRRTPMLLHLFKQFYELVLILLFFLELLYDLFHYLKLFVISLEICFGNFSLLFFEIAFIVFFCFQQRLIKQVFIHELLQKLTGGVLHIVVFEVLEHLFEPFSYIIVALHYQAIILPPFQLTQLGSSINRPAYQ